MTYYARSTYEAKLDSFLDFWKLMLPVEELDSSLNRDKMPMYMESQYK
jgi:hypothetical protein